MRLETAAEAPQDVAMEPGSVRHECVDCGAYYVLTQGQRNWYVNKGLHMPKRCDACRAERKRAQESA